MPYTNQTILVSVIQNLKIFNKEKMVMEFKVRTFLATVVMFLLASKVLIIESEGAGEVGHLRY